LISGKLPILEDVFELPYKTPTKMIDEDEPEKLFDEIDLQFIFEDELEVKYDDYKNKKENKIKLYIFFERTPGIKI
jgi:hypothetical protein